MQRTLYCFAWFHFHTGLTEPHEQWARFPSALSSPTHEFLLQGAALCLRNMEEQYTLFHKGAFLFSPCKGKLPSAGGEKGQPLDEGRPTTGQSPALSPGERALGAGHGGRCRHQAGQQRGQFRGATRGGRQGGAKEKGKGERNEQREERRAAPGSWTAGRADSPPALAQYRQRGLGLRSPHAFRPVLNADGDRHYNADKGSSLHLPLDALCTEQRGKFSTTGHLNH